MIWSVLSIKRPILLGKPTDELEQYLFLPITNSFNQQSFGGSDRGMYGDTPAEIMHAVLLVLCEYIAECMVLTFTASTIDLISHVAVGIHQDSRGNNERDMPELGPF